MPIKRKSILVQTSLGKKTVAVRISAQVHAALEELEERAKSLGFSLAIDRANLVEEAFKKATAQGNAELNSLDRNAKAA